MQTQAETMRWRLGDVDTAGSRLLAEGEDRGNWGALLQFAWASIDSDSLTVFGGTANSAANHQREHAASMWTAAIQLMAVGLGWTDLRLGLQRAKSQHAFQSAKDPILRFLWRHFGESIYELETFVGAGSLGQTREALLRIRQNGFRLASLKRDDSSDAESAPMHLPSISGEQTEEYARRFEQLGSQRDSKNWLVRELFVGGYDPLHLDSHNAALLVPGWSWDMLGSGLILTDRGRVRAEVTCYQALPLTTPIHLLEAAERGLIESGGALEFQPRGWPSVGHFVFNKETGRAHRWGSEQAHLLGN